MIETNLILKIIEKNGTYCLEYQFLKKKDVFFS